MSRELLTACRHSSSYSYGKSISTTSPTFTPVKSCRSGPSVYLHLIYLMLETYTLIQVGVVTGGDTDAGVRKSKKEREDGRLVGGKRSKRVELHGSA